MLWRATTRAAVRNASRPLCWPPPSSLTMTTMLQEVLVVLDGTVFPSSFRRALSVLPSRSSVSLSSTTTATATSVTADGTSADPAPSWSSETSTMTTTTTTSTFETTTMTTTKISSARGSRNPTAASVIREGLLHLHRAGLRIQESPKTRRPLLVRGKETTSGTTSTAPLSRGGGGGGGGGAKSSGGGGGAMAASDFLLGGNNLIDADDDASSSTMPAAALIRVNRVLEAASDCLDDLCELDQGLTLGGEPIALVGARISPDGRTAGILWALPWSILLQLEEIGNRHGGLREIQLREELTLKFSDELDTPGTRAHRALGHLRSRLSGKLAKVLRRPPKVQFYPAPPEEVAAAVRGLAASSSSSSNSE